MEINTVVDMWLDSNKWSGMSIILDRCNYSVYKDLILP